MAGERFFDARRVTYALLAGAFLVGPLGFVAHEVPGLFGVPPDSARDVRAAWAIGAEAFFALALAVFARWVVPAGPARSTGGLAFGALLGVGSILPSALLLVWASGFDPDPFGLAELVAVLGLTLLHAVPTGAMAGDLVWWTRPDQQAVRGVRPGLVDAYLVVGVAFGVYARAQGVYDLHGAHLVALALLAGRVAWYATLQRRAAAS